MPMDREQVQVVSAETGTALRQNVSTFPGVGLVIVVFGSLNQAIHAIASSHLRRHWNWKRDPMSVTVWFVAESLGMLQT